MAGGLACLWTRWVRGTPYIVSSGDAVGPWVSTRLPLVGLAFGAYRAAAVSLGGRVHRLEPVPRRPGVAFRRARAMTAAGWAPFNEPTSNSRRVAQVRKRLGIPSESVIFGIVGSLVWSSRARYCYGLELLSAIKQTDRADVHALIVGEGSGLAHLQEAAGKDQRVSCPAPCRGIG